MLGQAAGRFRGAQCRTLSSGCRLLPCSLRLRGGSQRQRHAARYSFHFLLTRRPAVGAGRALQKLHEALLQTCDMSGALQAASRRLQSGGEQWISGQRR